MALTYSATESNSNAAAASISVNVPAGAAEGYLARATIVHDGDSSSSITCTGWTVQEYIQGAQHNGALLTRILGGSEPSAYTFTVNGGDAGVGICGRMSTYNPNGGTVSIDDAASVQSVGEQSSLTTASVTGVSGGIMDQTWSNDSTATVSSAPSGYTIQGAVVDPGAVAMVSYYKESISGGAETASLTWSATDELLAFSLTASASGGRSGASLLRMGDLTTIGGITG